MRIPVLALSALLLAACTPVISQRGYLPDPGGEAAIRVGVDSKTTVQKRLGDPSTQSTFSGNSSSWYYISSVEKQIAFFNPEVESRKILAINFDKDGKVTALRHYSLKDGHIVSFETRETPSLGKEMTFLQQLFNATPGVPIGGSGQQSPGGGGM
ncbi:MAG TPA: outer membrane protein assembly factor BamE [Rhizomicrobium sp.]|nr:outer membrane protein assembly factor BamE [Rhizomicrobium sp.]